MTCIAYRNGVIASDTFGQVNEVKTVGAYRKIAKRRGHLFGVAGNDIPDIADLIEWYFAGAPTGEMQPHKFDALVIPPSGRIELWDQRGACDVLTKHPYWAIGAGEEYALGAMRAGATAEQAVAAAIEFSPLCCGRVAMRRLSC